LTGRRLPFGRLRSPVGALARADAVIVDGPARGETIAAIRAHVRADRAPIFTMTRRLGPPRPIDGPPARDLGPAGLAADVGIDAASGSFVAVAGIASPDRFSRALQDAGFVLARAIGFPDHHLYDRRDVERMMDAVSETGAWGVLTTEKDAVRLLPLRPLPMRVAAVPLEVSIDPCAEVSGESRPFRDWLKSAFRGARR
jgi:tetraacyldisaccharide 4'-kinase